MQTGWFENTRCVRQNDYPNRNIIFSILFSFCLCTKSLLQRLNIIASNEKTFQPRILTSLRKSSLVASFLWPASGAYKEITFSLIFRLNAFWVSVCTKDSLICFADRGEGEWDWCVSRDFRFMNFTIFFSIQFVNFYFFVNSLIFSTLFFYPWNLPEKIFIS